MPGISCRCIATLLPPLRLAPSGGPGRSRTRPVRPVPAGMRAPTLPRVGETPACALPAGVEGVAEVAAGRACDERAMQHEKNFRERPSQKFSIGAQCAPSRRHHGVAGGPGKRSGFNTKCLRISGSRLYWAARSPRPLRRVGEGFGKRPLHEVLTKPKRAARMCGSLGGNGYGHRRGGSEASSSRGVDETKTGCQNERLASTETSGNGGRR